MRYMRVEKVPATTRQVVDRVTCDLCGDVIRKKMYSAEEVKVNHRIGNSYPEGGSGTDTSFDICGKCFDERLVPWLQSQGANPRIEDWDWDWD
jgi:hypothetical protein